MGEMRAVWYCAESAEFAAPSWDFGCSTFDSEGVLVTQGLDWFRKRHCGASSTIGAHIPKLLRFMISRYGICLLFYLRDSSFNCNRFWHHISCVGFSALTISTLQGKLQRT